MESFSPEVEVDSLASLEGAENARIMLIAFFSLMVYEWMITLDEEVKYFWTGRWDVSRILFLMNRYLPLLIMVMSLICFSVQDPTPEFCRRMLQATFIMSILSIGIIQGMLVVRVWYLFSNSRPVRIAIIMGFMASILASFYFVVMSARKLSILEKIHSVIGCRAARPDNFWRIFLPSLVLHTVLYVLTALRALKNRRLIKQAPMLKRLLRDGGFFYFVVFVSATLTTIGSFLTQYPTINIPSIFSNFLLAITSIAVTRVMLSVHSLAAKLGSDSAWLLNNIELSRVPWRYGSSEGELIVDRFLTSDEDIQMSDDDSMKGHDPYSIKTTRVGMWNDHTSW